MGSLLKGIGKVAKIAGAPVLGFAVGGPAGAVSALLSTTTAGAEKKRSKARGSKAHKITSPIAAVAAPTAVAAIANALGVQDAGALLSGSGPAGVPESVLIGALVVFLHQLARALERYASTPAP